MFGESVITQFSKAGKVMAKISAFDNDGNNYLLYRWYFYLNFTYNKLFNIEYFPSQIVTVITGHKEHIVSDNYWDISAKYLSTVLTVFANKNKH